ncbi:LysR family transcriptional regulator [Cohaesibacter celericrescens]|uniref:LysR family transcriptional regulator n=1 Tax=Cohaesibacter celericrescens TaxID=2067669 RepID=A0A2N5XU47_9HYPH|nr:LysR family transcriptional regulator [Cohaesibacter celericrescens]PLW78000.1 LysR family transcriptional regulator [Cohaesibacter celericrescens]
MPSIQQLRVFAAVARYENLGDASQDVCLSKGAVSQSLGELEKRLGTPLFDRVHPRLKLNDQGRQLQVLAEDILDRMQDIRHLFDQGGEPVGALRIGASQTIGNYLLPRLLSGVSGLEAKVQIHNTYDLCEMLSRFELDLALIEGQSHHADLTTEIWREDEMLLVVPPDHALVRKGACHLSDLSNYNWVLREAHSGSREQFDQKIAPHIGTVGRIMELNTLEAVMLSVEQGLGLTFVSKLAVEDRLQQNRLAHVALNQRYTRSLMFVWHRQKFHSALQRHFISYVRQH